MNECDICHQAIADDRMLCEACENSLREEQQPKVCEKDAERVFLERQAKACGVE